MLQIVNLTNHPLTCPVTVSKPDSAGVHVCELRFRGLSFSIHGTLDELDALAISLAAAIHAAKTEYCVTCGKPTSDPIHERDGGCARATVELTPAQQAAHARQDAVQLIPGPHDTPTPVVRQPIAGMCFECQQPLSDVEVKAGFTVHSACLPF